ncbi:unnamed protein product [Ectocarpus sp. 12 AP-2014]
MSSDDGSCGNEEGEECTEWPEWGYILLSWAFAGFVINGFLEVRYCPRNFFATLFDRIGILRRGSDCDRCLRSGSCFLNEFFPLVFLFCVLGPLPAVILLCWYLCRSCIDLCRQPARRRTQRAVDRLRRFPDHKRWRARGWLIMLRARHQRLLARSKGWPIRLRKLERYNMPNIAKYATRNFMGDQSSPELELLEAGRSRMSFVRAVMAVVEINEEGLFHHIIKFL